MLPPDQKLEAGQPVFLQSQLRLQHEEELVLAKASFRVADQGKCILYWRSLSHWCSASSDAVKLRGEPRIVFRTQGLVPRTVRVFYPGVRLQLQVLYGNPLLASLGAH